MRIAARSHRNTMRPHLMFSALSVDQDLSLKHNQSLVQVWVGVKRGRLALRHAVFHQQECSVGLLSGRLPDVHTSACEPEALPLSLPSDDRPCSAHCAFSFRLRYLSSGTVDPGPESGYDGNLSYLSSAFGRSGKDHLSE